MLYNITTSVTLISMIVILFCIFCDLNSVPNVEHAKIDSTIIFIDGTYTTTGITK